ncbi:HTH domain-containing protein [Clostridium sp. 1001271B_151109_B4]|uniref:helix-turn-helix transcriptional regulator n=1 Tax=Clostridium sp. 1001271B_151109_B4 TaxID=2787148 RepID=UPI0018A9740F|nr:HTH domain-containing protein [Clostridium sp. 1001271B_151109_B4]
MRLLDIIFYLLRRGSKITMRELAENFNVSIKTIQRDLDKLSVVGIPLIIYRGKNGGVEIDRNYDISRLILRYKDYENLIFAIYISEGISENLREAYLSDRFRIIDNDRYSEILNKYKKRYILDYNVKFDIRSEVCKIIDNALDNKFFIEVYMSDRKIKAFPICYIIRNEGLYLYCYNGEYFLVSVNEIQEVLIVNKIYEGNIIRYEDNKEKLYIK